MDEAITRVERAAAAVDPVMAAVTPADLALPTPCEGWDLRTLLDHFFGNLHRWAARLNGGDPTAPTPTLADAGDDVEAAWRTARDALLEALRVPGAIDREVPMPGGRVANSRMLVGIMPVELLLHGWDAARAVGAPADFDPQLAGELLETARPLMENAGRGSSFAEEQPAPAGCTAADRLAAFSGRRVG